MNYPVPTGTGGTSSTTIVPGRRILKVSSSFTMVFEVLISISGNLLKVSVARHRTSVVLTL